MQPQTSNSFHYVNRWVLVAVAALAVAGLVGCPPGALPELERGPFAFDVTVPHPATEPPTLVGITVAPLSVTFSDHAATQQLRVSGTYSDKSTKDLTGTSSYQSSDAGVATVTAEGVVTPVADGDAAITVTYSGFFATCNVHVAFVSTATLTGMTVAPGTIMFANPTDRQQLQVTGTYSDGGTKDLTAASTGTTYQSSNSQIATVTDEGEVAPNASGQADITISNSDLSANVSVTVPGPGLITATATPTKDQVPLAVELDATGGDGALLYEWDFDGDGTYDYSNKTTPRTTRIYAVEGVYTATVRASDNSNFASIGTVEITAQPGLLAMARAEPAEGSVPLMVYFIPKGKTKGAAVLWYDWDLDGDGEYDTLDSGWGRARPNAKTHQFTEAGTYNVTLRIQDEDGKEAFDTVTVKVNDVPPFAQAHVAPSNGPTPLSSTFDGTAWPGSGGPIVLYEWDFDGDGKFDASSSDDADADRTLSGEGTYPAAFRVTDEKGLTTTVSDFLTEARVGPPGSPSVTAWPKRTETNASVTVNFRCTATDNGDDTIVKYEWDFDYDGTFAADETSDSDCSTSHEYTAAGKHYAAIRVTDNDGLTGIDVVVIDIDPQIGLSIPDDTFDPHQGETTTVSTTISADVDVHVYVRDEKHEVIRTLFKGRRTAETYEDTWDGRTDDGELPLDGSYFAYIDYTVDGVTFTKPDAPSGHREYQATGSEEPTSSGVFKPWEDEFWSLTFDTSNYGASEVTVTITPYQKSDIVIVEPLARDVFGTGSYTTYWEGVTAKGQYITDSNRDIGSGGDFLWAGFGYTLPDNTIVIEGGRPVISNPTATPNYVQDPGAPSCGSTAGPIGTEIGFDLSMDATVSLRMFNMETGRLLGVINTESLKAGPQSVFWDCRSVSGEFVEGGRYRVETTATAADGNVSRMRRVLAQVSY